MKSLILMYNNDKFELPVGIFTIQEICSLLNRSPESIYGACRRGHVVKKQYKLQLMSFSEEI